MPDPDRPRVPRWRTAVAALLYLLAAGCLAAGLMLGWDGARLMARNRLTGDFTGAALAFSTALAWLLPLALAATIVALQLRSPAGAPPDDGAVGLDRRLMRALDRAGSWPRRIGAAGLVLAALALVGVLPVANSGWLVPAIRDRQLGTSLARAAAPGLLLFGPLLALALACASLAWRLLRGRAATPGGPDPVC